MNMINEGENELPNGVRKVLNISEMMARVVVKDQQIITNSIY